TERTSTLFPYTTLFRSNYPQYKYAVWFLSQYRRWGMVGAGVDYMGIARQVMRPDLYEEAMKEIGYAHGGASVAAETLFDGKVFRSEEHTSELQSPDHLV